MSWSHNVYKLASAGLLSAFLVSNASYAQTPSASPAAESLAASSRNSGESIADYIVRVSETSPQSVSSIVGDALRANPADLGELIKIAAAATPNTVAADVARGIVLAAAASPVAITQQASAFALVDPRNVGSVITLARQSNSNPLSEVLGEGLALAASTLRSQGTSTGNADAIAIQTQATAQGAPLALSEAFMDNYIPTAAGAAGPGAAGPAGGGDVSNNAGNFNAGAGTPGAGGGAVAQQGASRTAFSSSGFSFTTTNPTTNFNTTLPVPGPEAGAGIGTVLSAVVIYFLRRRKVAGRSQSAM